MTQFIRFILLAFACFNSAFAEQKTYPHLNLNHKMIAEIKLKISKDPWKKQWAEILKKSDLFLKDKNEYGIYWWDAGMRYLVTGDKKYGQPILDDLRHWARTDTVAKAKSWVTSFKRGRYDWNVARPALKFDMVASMTSPEDKAKILKTMREFGHARMTWVKKYNGSPSMVFLVHHGLAAIGFMTHDKGLIDFAINSPRGGFKNYMTKFRDGRFWIEPTLYGMRTGLMPALSFAEMSANSGGEDLYKYKAKNPYKGEFTTLQKIIDGFISLAYPLEKTAVGNGSIRLVSWGDAGSHRPNSASPGDNFLINQPTFQKGNHQDTRTLGYALEIAYRRFKDAKYAWFLKQTPERRHHANWNLFNFTGLTHGVELPEKVDPPPAASYAELRGGHAMMRADETSNYWHSGKPVAWMNLNQSYKYLHGHHDMMQLIFHAKGRLIYPDIDVQQYEPRKIRWTHDAVCHNTVLVNRKQPEGSFNGLGKYQKLRKDFNNDLKFTAVTGDPYDENWNNNPLSPDSTWKRPEAMPWILQTRALILTEDYLFDVFDIRNQGREKDKTREYIWFLHGFGRLSTDYESALNNKNALLIPRFKNTPKRERIIEKHDGPMRATWVQNTQGVIRGQGYWGKAWFNQTVGVRMTMLGEAKSAYSFAEGPYLPDAPRGI
ncbi:MAG: hypothetical protein MJH11_18355, partial [Lentisphaeria bacterium]|nr:hypothetical protein [Lentisphaeria bacterium]